MAKPPKPAAAKKPARPLRVEAANPPWLRWISDNPFQCWVWATIVMFLLAAVSVGIGIGSVEFDGTLSNGHRVPAPWVEEVKVAGSDTATQSVQHTYMKAPKEVGYLWAINWTLYGVILVPLMVVFSAQTWSAMPRVLDALADHGMARDDKLDRIPDGDLVASWIRARRRCGLIFLTIFVCCMGFAMADWWGVVMGPITDPGRLMGATTLAHPSMEFDWSIACTFQGGNPKECKTLLTFGFIAYLLIPGLSVALAFATVVGALYFVVFASGGVGGESWKLVAVPPGSGDKRGGFDRFSEFFTPFLLLALCVVVACLMMILQNAYLRDPTSPNIFEFVFGNIDGFKEAIDKFKLTNPMSLGFLSDWLFKPTRTFYENPQMAMGTLLVGFTSLVSVAISWGLLRSASRKAQALSLEHAPALAAEQGISPATLRSRLRDMEFWPLAWVKLNTLLVMIACLVAALVSYRLVLIPIVWVALQVGKQFIGLIKFGGQSRRG